MTPQIKSSPLCVFVHEVFLGHGHTQSFTQGPWLLCMTGAEMSICHGD